MDRHGLAWLVWEDLGPACLHWAHGILHGQCALVLVCTVLTCFDTTSGYKQKQTGVPHSPTALCYSGTWCFVLHVVFKSLPKACFFFRDNIDDLWIEIAEFSSRVSNRDTAGAWSSSSCRSKSMRWGVLRDAFQQWLSSTWKCWKDYSAKCALVRTARLSWAGSEVVWSHILKRHADELTKC